jgi:hypothetical protein
MAGTNRGIVMRQVLGNLNANPGAYIASPPASQDEAYADFAVIDAILDAEAFLLHKIAESWFNGNRTNESPLTDIIETFEVAHGDLVPRHMGPVIGVKIDGRVAVALPAEQVDYLRLRNPLRLKLAPVGYALEDNRLFFTTASENGGVGAPNPTLKAEVYCYVFDRPTFATVTLFAASDSPVPPEYAGAWVDWATGRVISREGANLNAAQFYTIRAERVWQELTAENRPKAFAADAQRIGE